MRIPREYVSSIKRSLSRHGLNIGDRLASAIETIPRELFVGKYKTEAYNDNPLPIPKNQTISAPHMYAMMLSKDIADINKGMDILEIGTGSGYGAALLAHMVHPGKVISIERHSELVEFAKNNVTSLNIDNLTIIEGDGTSPELEITFDRVIVTAAGPRIPPVYYSLLKADGKIIMPLQKNNEQWLVVITYPKGKEHIDWLFRVRFVPLIGRFGH